MRKMNFYVLIPAYRPDDKLLHLMESLHAAGLRNILVVNDGSGNAHEAVFRTIRERWSHVVILSHDVNRGKGAALKTGFRYLLEHADGIDGAVTADSDGQHTAEDILRIMAVMEKQPGKLILGTRTFDGTVPWRSCFGNRLTSFLIRRLYGLKIQDTQTGLRGIPLSMMPLFLEIPCNQYEFELDMLILAGSRHLNVCEVPVRTIYIDNNASSHFHPFRDSLKIYSVLFRNLFSKR